MNKKNEEEMEEALKSNANGRTRELLTCCRNACWVVFVSAPKFVFYCATAALHIYREVRDVGFDEGGIGFSSC
ncbi:hypothetical protein AMTR_s00078p00032530 [Amborella trichopoda]|uniref:Uncharacterized protein n=1 Tax=Amborella trichopoda TaxID=13333 RepID=W1P9S2_AMBTC|nr:hypothetical protein AMTR_s00078p00032530 [Amborella trichopoda]